MLSTFIQVQGNLTVEGAAVAMDTKFPDAPDDVFSETLAYEQKRKVRVQSLKLLLCTEL